MNIKDAIEVLQKMQAAGETNVVWAVVPRAEAEKQAGVAIPVEEWPQLSGWLQDQIHWSSMNDQLSELINLED